MNELKSFKNITFIPEQRPLKSAPLFRRKVGKGTSAAVRLRPTAELSFAAPAVY